MTQNAPQTHYYSRKWFFESLICGPTPYAWRPNDITKILYAVAEKYIRDKKMYQPHVDSANVCLQQYILEILDTSHDGSIFIRDEEHTLFMENIRYVPPTETLAKSNISIRLLPNQCNRRILNYNFNILVDIVYKVYKCPVPYPPEMTAPEEKVNFEKEWIRMRELQKKEMGRIKYYQSYGPEDGRIVEILPNVSLGLYPAIVGSLLCHIQNVLLQPGEGLSDPMGVFCVGGTYRLISPLKDLILNQDFADNDGKCTVGEVWSISEQKLHHSTQTISIHYDTKLDKNRRCKRSIGVILPFSKCALDITIIFIALGFTPTDLLWAVRFAARKQWRDSYGEILNIIAQNCTVTDEEQAYLCIAEVEGKVLTAPKAYIIKSAKIKLHQQLLPRLGQSHHANLAKARFLGYLVWRVLMQGEQQKVNDPYAEETHAVIEDYEYPIPKWMKVEKQGEQRQKKKHRDHLANCRSDFHGVLVASLFRQIFGRHWKQVRSHLQATLNGNKVVSLIKFFKNTKKGAARIQYCISTGRWSAAKERDSRKGITQPLAISSAIAQESHYTYHSTAMNPDGKNTAPRQIHESQFLNLCPAETPETKKCGLTGHSSQLEEFCIGSPGIELEKTLKFYDEELCFIPDFRWLEIYIHHETPFKETAFDNYTQIILNGKPIGYTPYPEHFVKMFITLRRTLTIDPFASIFFDPILDILQIRTDRGRVAAPFLIFPRLHHLMAQLPEMYRESKAPPSYISAMSGASFTGPAFVGPRAQLGISGKYRYQPVPEDPDLAKEREVMAAVLPWNVLHSFSMANLLRQGLIDYLDPAERKMTVIALQENDFWKRYQRGQLVFTHITLDPHFMFSVCTGLTPYANHNQSPRNTYNVAMKKAHADLPLDQYIVSKTKHEALYSQVPFVRTISNDYMNGKLSTSIIEPIGALIPYFGFSVEDAQNLSKTYTQRGAGLIVTSRLYRVEHKRKKSTSSREVFGKPNPEDCIGLKFANYDKLTDAGIPLAGTIVKQGDVLIGQTSHFRPPVNPNFTHASQMIQLRKKRKDNSVVYNHDEEAMVVSAIVGTNLDGTQFARVEVRSMRYPSKGDKGTTSSAQKGTKSVLIVHEDCVETADGSGVTMEYLVNSQALPKRMTCAMPVEMGFSIAVNRGLMRFSDATSFRNQVSHLDDLRSSLKQLGMSFKGSMMRDGRTGREIQGFIFYAPLGYAKLKHIAKDKAHVRASGPVNPLTRQPVEGRAKQGGLRFGEMERACLAAQNAALLLRQQMHDIADAYKIPICQNCRFFANKHIYDKSAYCPVCKSRNTLLVDICYAYKLLSQELMANMIFLQTEVVPEDNPKAHLYTALKEDDLYAM